MGVTPFFHHLYIIVAIMPIAGFKIPSWSRWVFSIAVMVFIFTQVDFSVFGEALLNANPLWLLVGLGMIFMETFAVALAWRSMLRTKGYNPPFWRMVQIMLTANYLGFILPSSMGSDVMKVVGLSKYIGSASEALSSLFLFRVIGYGALFFIALVTSILFGGYLPEEPVIESIKYLLIIGFVAGGVGLFFIGPVMGLAKGLLLSIGLNSIFDKLKKIHDAMGEYLKYPGAMAKAGLGATFMQIDRIVYVYIIALALDITVEPLTLCLFVPIITVLTTIPVSISGIGVREGGYVFLFGLVGLSSAEALGLSLCGFALDLLFVLLGGVVYMIFGFPKKLDGEHDIDKLMAEEPVSKL